MALALLSLLGGCATFPGARPLDPGQHEIGVTIGGPTVNLGGPLALPNINLQARHGLVKRWERPLDITYGLNLIALPFGLLQGHVGLSYLVIPQRGPAPALAVSTKQFLAMNGPGLRAKPAAELAGWTANQLDLYLSWEISRQLIYLGLTQYTDFGSPHLTLTPSVGVVVDTTPKTPGGVMLNLDLRWYAMTQRNDYDAVRWVPEALGAFGLGVGVSVVFPGRAGKKAAAATQPEPEAQP